MRWERVRTQPGGPGPRWGHSCNAVCGGRLVYVFGGYGQGNRHTNKVHVFDTVTQIWSEPQMKGVPPTPRDSHTCNADGDYLYVFGGTDGKRPLNDLHILDTTSNTWSSPSIRGDGPAPREGHSAAVVGRRLYIFGGCGKSGKSADGGDEIYYNDLYILNTETLTWRRAVTAGIPPSPRDSHTCSSWNNKIVVIGGEDDNDYYLSDVHIFDTETSIWRVLKTSGDNFRPRGGHGTVSFGKYLIIFGGFSDERNLYDDLHILDVETGLWSRLLTEGHGPSARFSVAGDCLEPTMSGIVMFIGGCNRNLEPLDDMYYMNTGLFMEPPREGRRLEKLSLRKQLKIKVQGQQPSQPVLERALLGTLYNQPSQAIVPYGSKGIRSFQARITQNLSAGFAIETVIDGKPLRGVIFSSNGPNECTQKPIGSFSEITPIVKVCGAPPTKQKEPVTATNAGQVTASPMEHDATKEKQAGDLHEKELKSRDARSDADKDHGIAIVPVGDAPASIQMLQEESKIDSGQDCSTAGS